MGRKKTRLKKIENQTYKSITFAKRKSGLLKKVYELSTLCDTQIAIIIFSPAGKLFLFEGKNRLEDIFEQYFDLPIQQRARQHNEEMIKPIIRQMSVETNVYQQFQMINSLLSFDTKASNKSEKEATSEMKMIRYEVQKCCSELEKVEKEISELLRSPSSIPTVAEAKFHEKILIQTLNNVQNRKRPFFQLHDSFFMKSSSHNQADRPPQFNIDVTGSLLFSNQQQPTLQMNEHNDAYLPYSQNQVAQFENINLHSTAISDTFKQGSGSSAQVQDEEEDLAMGILSNRLMIWENNHLSFFN